MRKSNQIKTAGYLVSSVSVVLLAAPAWKTALEHPLSAGALIAGMAASITGMALRWWSYQVEKEGGDA